MKKVLIKGIVIFLVLMMIFTIISRIIFQLCTPNVVATVAKDGAISTRIEMEGCVKGKQEVAMVSKEGLQIATIFADEGDYVAEGDVLYQYNTEKLEKGIENLKNEVEILRLQIGETEKNLTTRKQRNESSALQQDYISKEQKETEINELEELLKHEGKVYAQINGQIVKVYIEPGSITTGTADMLLINEVGSKIVEFMLEENGEESVSAEDIRVGDKVQVSDIQDELQECGVIGKQQEESGAWKFVVDVSELQVPINEKVSIQIQNTTNQYLYVIPREALRQGDGNKYFVYVAEEKETILGTEYRARRQEVKVLEMNSWEAAIENISFTQKIITDSDKPLSDNCRVSYVVEE